MNKIIHYVWQAIKLENTIETNPIFDTVKPIRSTVDMRTWYTSKPCEWVRALNTHGGFGKWAWQYPDIPAIWKQY